MTPEIPKTTSFLTGSQILPLPLAVSGPPFESPERCLAGRGFRISIDLEREHRMAEQVVVDPRWNDRPIGRLRAWQTVVNARKLASSVGERLPSSLNSIMTVIWGREKLEDGPERI